MEKAIDKEIDIDRQKIVIYWRVQGIYGLLALVIVLCAVAWFWIVLRFFVRHNYWDVGTIVLLVVTLVGIIVLISALVYVLWMYILPWYYRRWANALRYCLSSRALRVESGVLFRSRKTIPFDKITSLELAQGPLLWYFGLWIIRIQTASTSAQTPEAILWGVIDPLQARDDMLAARDEYIKLQ